MEKRLAEMLDLEILTVLKLVEVMVLKLDMLVKYWVAKMEVTLVMLGLS